MGRRALLLYFAFSSTAFPAEMPGRALFLDGGSRLDWKALGYAGDPRSSMK
ncbi:MAG: hypothetical protein NTX56_17075 [Proteobacteria bacterium]|nr:hypothetical protein [Pseudomonadota bacterium]